MMNPQPIEKRCDVVLQVNLGAFLLFASDMQFRSFAQNINQPVLGVTRDSVVLQLNKQYFKANKQ
jgi:hypothetical protein